MLPKYLAQDKTSHKMSSSCFSLMSSPVPSKYLCKSMDVKNYALDLSFQSQDHSELWNRDITYLQEIKSIDKVLNLNIFPSTLKVLRFVFHPCPIFDICKWNDSFAYSNLKIEIQSIKCILLPLFYLLKGAFISHVDMAGGGGLPNVHITT